MSLATNCCGLEREAIDATNGREDCFQGNERDSTCPLVPLGVEGKCRLRDQLQSIPCVLMRKICPAPGPGAPKPMFET